MRRMGGMDADLDLVSDRSFGRAAIESTRSIVGRSINVLQAMNIQIIDESREPFRVPTDQRTPVGRLKLCVRRSLLRKIRAARKWNLKVLRELAGSRIMRDHMARNAG